MPDFEINSTLNYYKWYHHIINVLEVAVVRDITNTESLLKIIPDFIYLSFRPVMIMFRRYFFPFLALSYINIRKVAYEMMDIYQFWLLCIKMMIEKI